MYPFRQFQAAASSIVENTYHILLLLILALGPVRSPYLPHFITIMSVDTFNNFRLLEMSLKIRLVGHLEYESDRKQSDNKLCSRCHSFSVSASYAKFLSLFSWDYLQFSYRQCHPFVCILEELPNLSNNFIGNPTSLDSGINLGTIKSWPSANLSKKKPGTRRIHQIVRWEEV